MAPPGDSAAFGGDMNRPRRIQRAEAVRPSREGRMNRRAPKTSREAEDWTLEAELQTSPATGERLVEALRRGYQHFVLTSRDGIVSARVRLRIAGLARTRHCIGGRTLLIDWGNLRIHVQSEV